MSTFTRKGNLVPMHAQKNHTSPVLYVAMAVMAITAASIGTWLYVQRDDTDPEYVCQEFGLDRPARTEVDQALANGPVNFSDDPYVDPATGDTLMVLDPETNTEHVMTEKEFFEDILAVAKELDKQLVDNAPEEIRDDVRTIIEARSEAERTGAVRDQEALAEADTAVNAWLQDTCPVLLNPSTDNPN